MENVKVLKYFDANKAISSVNTLVNMFQETLCASLILIL